MVKKGVILSGGTGSRLKPLTIAVTKQLLNVYDRPLIFLPLCTLLEQGIQDILIIVKPNEEDLYRTLLNDGEQFGINISYQIQQTPNGIAEAVYLSRKFVDDEYTLILGDNFFSHLDAEYHFKTAGHAKIFCKQVLNPNDYGVLEISDNKKIKLIEKPKKWISDFAITGMYMLDKDSFLFFKNIKKSERGEFEIVDILNFYLKENRLDYSILQKDNLWADNGTADDLNNTSNYLRKHCRIMPDSYCPYLISYKKGWISKNDLLSTVEKFDSTYFSRITNFLVHE